MFTDFHVHIDYLFESHVICYCSKILEALKSATTPLTLVSFHSFSKSARDNVIVNISWEIASEFVRRSQKFHQLAHDELRRRAICVNGLVQVHPVD